MPYEILFLLAYYFIQAIKCFFVLWKDEMTQSFYTEASRIQWSNRKEVQRWLALKPLMV